MTSIDAKTKKEIIKALRSDARSDADTERQATKLMELLENGGIENLHPALKPWVRETILGPMVKHPYVFVNMLGGMGAQTANEIYEWKRKVRREYINERDWSQFIYAHERPWRMVALERLWERGRITLDELRAVLPEIWIDTEMPEGNQQEPMYLFREAGFVTDDQKSFDALPDEIVLYRGVDGEFEITPSGPSWTTQLHTARIFAYRFGAHGIVYRYRAKKSEALAWFTGRDEAEIILDFGNESDLERIEVEEDRPPKT
jgi:hypothetical protein